MPRYKLFLGASGIALFGAFVAFIGLGLWGAIPGFMTAKKPVPNYPLSIAVINLSRVKAEALAFQNLTNFIEKRNSDFHAEILPAETKLREEHEAIQKQEKNGEPATPELVKKVEEFDKRVAELEQIAQQGKTQLTIEIEQIAIEISEKLKKIIERLGRERNLNLILNATFKETLLEATVVLYGGNDVDITDEVIDQLNKELPTIQVAGTSVSSASAASAVTPKVETQKTEAAATVPPLKDGANKEKPTEGKNNYG